MNEFPFANGPIGFIARFSFGGSSSGWMTTQTLPVMVQNWS